MSTVKRVPVRSPVVASFLEGYCGSVVCGDCVSVLSEFPDCCVDLVVTSPPYDKLRKYGGFADFDFEGLAAQLFRVVRGGRVVVWVCGDATIDGSETGTSFRQALHFMSIGFNLHDTMIFRKRNPLPQLKRMRYMSEFEFMFVLSKGRVVVCNYLTVPCKHAGLENIRTKNYSAGDQSERVTKLTVGKEKVVGNVWTYNVGTPSSEDKIAFKHPAVFPENLARDHILTWTNPGDLVLDPMCGSGTTCKMADRNGRRFIGVDINAEYVAIAKTRLGLE